MKNEIGFTRSFMQYPERDFYIALYFDLNRIFRYDTDRIMQMCWWIWAGVTAMWQVLR